MTLGRRGLLKRILALAAAPVLPAAAATATVRPAVVIGEGWVLTEKDMAEIARLAR